VFAGAATHRRAPVRDGQSAPNECGVQPKEATMNDVRREKYQVMPALPAEDYEALKADIAARGVMVAIEVDEYGNILDGYNRIKVCRELGINDYPVVVRSGLSEAEKLTHARRVNLLRRHLSQEQRRQLVADELRGDPSRSDRQIAAGSASTTKPSGLREIDWAELGKFPSWRKRPGRTAKRGRLIDSISDG